MQWMDVLIVLLLAVAVFKAFTYYRNHNSNGGCHGGCGSCSQQCAYRESENKINIQ